MTITVNTPDGGTASFPDDTDPGAITSAMKAKFGGPASSGYGADDSLASKAGNTAYRAADTGTLGALDWGLAGIHKLERATGYDPNATDIDQIHAQNADWQSAHPLLALGGDVVGYGAGLGKLGIAARLAKGAEGLGASAGAARALGGAGEAAGLTAAGDVGHGETPGMDVLYAGGAGGALGAALGGKAAAPVGQSIADLQGASKSAFGVMDAAPVARADLTSAVNDPINSLTPGQKFGISPGMQEQIDKTNTIINQSPSLSVGDAYSARRNIGNAARTPEDKILAKKVGDSLMDLAPDQMKEASLAHGRLQDATWLSDQSLSPQDLRNQAQGNLDSPMMAMDDTSQQAMQKLAGSAPGRARTAVGNLAGLGVNMIPSTLLGGGLGDAALGGILGFDRGANSGLGALAKNHILNAPTAKARRAAIAAIGGNLPPSLGSRAGALASYGYGPLSTLLNAKASAGSL
jgi:hypothetical protein